MMAGRMARPSGPSLLERWLDNTGTPSANSHHHQSQRGIKRERSQTQDLLMPTPTSFSFDPLFGHDSALAGPSPVHQKSSSVAKPSSSKVEDDGKASSSETQIDTSSVNGRFGWESVNDLYFPVLFRNNDKDQLVPVRLPETKIIGKYSSILPWPVFSCINIRSYFMTDAEASLLNEINSNHCEHQLCGYDPFTVKDLLVMMPDVFLLSKFLETSKRIFKHGLANSQISTLGFISISGAIIVPYVTKKRADGTSGRYVPQSQISGVSLKDVERIEMEEWDSAYLRMLYVYAGFESDVQISASTDRLCLINDLKFDDSGCPLHIEQCSPPLTKPSSSRIAGGSMVSPSMISSSKMPSLNYTDYHHSTMPAPLSHKSRPSQSELSDPNWLLSSAGSSSHAVMSLHQISTEVIHNTKLTAINLKPYSSQRAVFLSEVLSKMLPGHSHITAQYILSDFLQVKLYDPTRVHQDAFLRAGVKPLDSDKLILVDVLRKCFNQLQQLMQIRHSLAADPYSAGISAMPGPSYVH